MSVTLKQFRFVLYFGRASGEIAERNWLFGHVILCMLADRVTELMGVEILE